MLKQKLTDFSLFKETKLPVFTFPEAPDHIHISNPPDILDEIWKIKERLADQRLREESFGITDDWQE